jgi:hydrogenase expression/formation protein HypC
MCLGIPGKIINIYETGSLKMAKVDYGGVVREACLETLPEARIGDYAIIHVGFAISLLSEKDAMETLNILNEMNRLADAETAEDRPLQEDV